jgi:hypothetical protein
MRSLSGRIFCSILHKERIERRVVIMSCSDGVRRTYTYSQIAPLKCCKFNFDVRVSG